MAEHRNEQPDEAEPAVTEEPLSKENRERILADHERWVGTEGQDGNAGNS